MRERTVPMIAEQRAALLRFLGSLDAAAWDAPTPCEGWTVRDVVAHLVEGELAVGRVLRGEREPGFIDLAAEIDRWRALPGEAVGAALWQHGGATQRLLEQMDDASWSAPIRALGCHRVSQLARLGLFEAIVHSWDVTTATGAPPVWDERIGVAAEHVLRAAPATLTRHGAAPDGVLGIQVGGRSAVLRGDDDGWRLVDPTEAVEPRARLETTPEALVLSTTGRADAAGRMDLDGDTGWARAILARWQVVAWELPTPPGPSR